MKQIWNGIKHLFKNMHKILCIFSLSSYFMILPLIGLSMEAKAGVTANIGPFKISRAFCEKIQTLSSILNAYTTVQWPVVGVPGITFGLLQNSSALLDFCAFLIQLETLGTVDATFYTLNYLNQMTDNRWQHHLDFMTEAWSLANDTVDMSTGKFNKAALKSPAYHREINDFSNTTYRWYNKTFNNKDAELKTREQRQGDLQALSSAAYNSAILKEVTACPNPSNNVNYDDIYRNKIYPNEVKANDAKDDVDFYRGQLYNMGARFMSNENQLNKYLKSLENMVNNAIVITTVEQNKTETTSKRVKDSTGKVVSQKQSFNRKIITYGTNRDQKPFTDFNNEYGDQWKTWVKAQYLSMGTRGILNNPQEKIESEFKDLNYECQAKKVMEKKGYSTDRPDYSKLVEDEVKNCVEKTKFKQKEAENLLVYYSNQLFDAISKMKSYQAIIYTVESKELGVNRAATKNPTDQYQTQDSVCENAYTALTPAVMQKINMKQQQINNDLTENMAKQLVQQNMILTEKEEASAKNADELNKRASFADRKAKDEAEMSKVITGPNAVNIKIPEGIK